uniref:MGAT4 conserved region domain-containing protein n=1 Tax=Ciona savignyi TaxID=51511 RepID=H2Z3K2_CIOSA
MLRIQRQHSIWIAILLLYGFTTLYYISLTRSGNAKQKTNIQDQVGFQSTQSFHKTVDRATQNIPQHGDQQPTQKVGTVSKYNHPYYPAEPLSGDLSHPVPGFKIGHSEKSAKVYIGIPTIKRDGVSYLLQTIDSLLSNLSPRRNDTAIVVYIGELDTEFVRSQAIEIMHTFPKEVADGTIQVISPPSNFYPDWDKVLPPSFNDPMNRIKWRSKQNLDQIFLMMYIYNLGADYYLMLEDDVQSSSHYMDTILQHAENLGQKDYFFISFCSLGAIGKLFRARTLPSYAAFIHIFWNRKPLDWLQLDYVSTQICSYDESDKQCAARRKHYMLEYKPALFQHVGKVSSLKGKQQLLKDNTFRV